MKRMKLKILVCISASIAAIISFTGFALADEITENEDIVVAGDNVSTEDIVDAEDIAPAEDIFVIEDSEEIEISRTETDAKEGWSHEGAYWYYYVNGKYLTGLQKIDNSTYYFNVAGRMCTGLQYVDGHCYFFSDSGKSLKGWQQCNGKWYFLDSNGYALKGWQKIDNNWYYFDEYRENDPYMKADTIYTDADGNSFYFDLKGKMYSGWLTIGNKKYYFGSNGKMANGWTEIGGKWYYFDTELTLHNMYKDGLCTIDGSLYLFNSNGSMHTGWKEINGKWYYFGTNGKAAVGKTKIGTKWYFFHEPSYSYETLDPYMLAGVSGSFGGKFYVLDGNGVMQLGWYKMESDFYGTRYYYLTTEGGATGWTEIGKKWYYFAPYTNDPYLYVSQYFSIDNNYYYVDENGVMQTGWISYNGNYFYGNSNGVLHNGWLKSGGKWYYFTPSSCSAPTMQIGIRSIDGDFYFFGKDGAMENGWQKRYETGDKYYYFGSDGKAVYGWQKIDGKWYYFNEPSGSYKDPYMFRGKKYMDGKWYFFEYSGALGSGWEKETDSKGKTSWYYLNSSGVMVTGWQKIGDNWYYFSETVDSYYTPYMYTDTLMPTEKGDNGNYLKYFYFDKDGRMLANEWHYDAKYDYWFYFGKNGVAVTGWNKIGGEWYYFKDPSTGWDPFMFKDGVKEIDGEYYLFDSKGVMQTGWAQYKNKWYLSDSKGRLSCKTWKTINGKHYYFDDKCCMATGYYKINDKLYHFDDNGVCLNYDD